MVWVPSLLTYSPSHSESQTGPSGSDPYWPTMTVASMVSHPVADDNQHSAHFQTGRLFYPPVQNGAAPLLQSDRFLLSQPSSGGNSE